MTHAHDGAPAPSAPSVPDEGTPAWRLLAVLGGSGALAGLLLVLAWQWTTPRVAAHRARVEQVAIAEVLKSPARTDTLFLQNGTLSRTPTGETTRLERVVQGFDEQGRRIGVAVVAGAPGFADVITVMIGFDPGSGVLTGIKILGQKETPGLGDKIELDPAFRQQFEGARAPLSAVRGRSGGDRSQVATITGATISSRAIVRIVNDAVSRWQPLVAAYAPEARP